MKSVEPLKYTPAIVSANRFQDIALGLNHTMLLFDNIQSEGDIQYAFLLGVFDNVTQEPVYFVSSEVNALAAAIGGGSHYLCIFDDTGHGNLGGSDDWGDPDKFFPQAVHLAAEHFGMSMEELPGQADGESVSDRGCVKTPKKLSDSEKFPTPQKMPRRFS